MTDITQSEQQTGVRGIIQRIFNGAPLLAIFLGFLVCTLWEMMFGEVLASVLLLPKMPILFGLVTMFKVIAGMINLVLKDTPFEYFLRQTVGGCFGSHAKGNSRCVQLLDKRPDVDLRHIGDDNGPLR